MSSAPVSKRRYQDSDSGPLNLRAERSGSLASWLRLPLAAFLNGRIMQHTCNLFDQVDFAKPKIWLQKCSIITEHLTIFFFARGFAPRTGDAAKVLSYNGFSSRYAVVTTFHTYPEPTPMCLTRRHTVPMLQCSIMKFSRYPGERRLTSF
jgi:hypothetical protein